MVVKKSVNQKLAPIAHIHKKITPVKKKFPHDFFSNGGGASNLPTASVINPEYQHNNEE
jgi:hypothetical protein